MEIQAQEVIDAYKQNLADAQHLLLLSQLTVRKLEARSTELEEEIKRLKSGSAELPSTPADLPNVPLGPRLPAQIVPDKSS